MTKTKNNKKVKKKKSVKTKISWRKSVLTFLLAPLLVGFILNIYFWNKALPNTKIAGINVGGLKKQEILLKLEEGVKNNTGIKIKIDYEQIELSLSNIDLIYNLESTVNKNINKRINFFIDPTSTLISYFYQPNEPLDFDYNEEKLDEFLSILVNENTKPAKRYSLTLQNNQIIVDGGSAGQSVDIPNLKSSILNTISYNQYAPIELTVFDVKDTLSEEEVAMLKLRAEKLIGKSIDLKHEYDTFGLEDKNIVTFLDKDNLYNTDLISEYVDTEIAPDIERLPQNAQFVFNNQKVEEFVPAKNGVEINKSELIKSIAEKLAELEKSENKTLTLQVPIVSSNPDITLDDVNNLGIKELIGRGVSYFRGSISSRIYNIGHASKKFNSVLVAPNEIFSFNNILGDVSALTGYKQAYIIQDGRTVLGDGGGVCQVSTTLFRAVLDAGLPVVERRAHSYRVGYYEQGSPVGLDATIYYPTTDFKFKNDTPEHILIQSVFDPANHTLVFEIYGTDDGRVSTIGKPVFASSTPPPEDLYVDDPSLPSGQIKQIDYKAWGAKILFDYKVERNGEILIDRTFVSNYRPWQSVFLRGTGETN